MSSLEYEILAILRVVDFVAIGYLACLGYEVWKYQERISRF